MKSIAIIIAATAFFILRAGADIIGTQPGHVRVLFAGDTCFGESYQDEYARTGGVNILAQKGYDYSLANLIPLLQSVDLRVMNLETPLTTNRGSALQGKDYVHYSSPVKTPEIFHAYRPIAFTLANNHTMDQGAIGLYDTLAALKGGDIHCFGAGKNLAEAAQPFVEKLQVGEKSITLAVFGAFEYRTNYDTDYHFYASADHPGTAAVDVSSVQQAIAELRQRDPDAYVVYFVHWGDNYRWKTPAETALAHALRQAGVDLVVGAHAHTMQEVESDGRGWIFYGVGNFVFNAEGRYMANHTAPISLPLVVDFSLKNGHLQTVFRVYPLVSDNDITDYQPRFVNETELSTVDALLAAKSEWSPSARAAVKRGSDKIGNYLEFLTPKTAQ